ncbi:hypothetical protein Verru16b_01486 [Lacunisphaera limnophila]|uniref:Uncharacterized protein n=1 Tax=Lacunisphaera limnophila TaxID=1838286 RepID=A0A1D8AU51_9BACT|nr:hypothetical protein [Lacunisphaera limnophila]AOS44424.1 hypothetical protein Verru16b_01486 [Lacunisphaera limnophila]
MKRYAPLVALALCLTLLSLPLLAQGTAKAETKTAKTPGLELAAMATQVTGIAISPLLGVSAVGAYQYFKAATPEEKAALPWFANPSFWALGVLMVAAVAFKDAAGATLPPGWKKPLDVLETIENKASGLVAAGAVIPSLITFGSKLFMDSAGFGGTVELHYTGLAMLPVASIDTGWLLSLLMVPLSVAVFAVVWLTAHAINVLILLSPWGAIDAALKGVRTGVLGLVTATAWIDPVVGATLSVVIIIFAYFTAGWAFRLMTFGSVFCWDFFTVRRKRFKLLADGNKLFTGAEFEGVPPRTYGRLHQAADGGLTLKFRPWLVFPAREVPVPRAGLVVGRGVFFSEVLGHDAKRDQNRTLLLLPPRYLGHEELFARTYHISGTCEVGLRKAWSWIKEAVGLGTKKTATTAV